MGGKAVPVGTKKEFGPYKGSKQNGGRPIKVTKVKGKDGKWHTTSKNKARDDYEKKTGRKLPKDVDVDHRNDKGRQGDDRLSNLQTLSHSKNVAKENRSRSKKKK